MLQTDKAEMGLGMLIEVLQDINEVQQEIRRDFAEQTRQSEAMHERFERQMERLMATVDMLKQLAYTN